MLWSELINMTIDLQSYGDIKHRHDRSGEETCRNLHNYIIIIDLTTLSKSPGVEQPVNFHVSEK